MSINLTEIEGCLFNYRHFFFLNKLLKHTLHTYIGLICQPTVSNSEYTFNTEEL